VKKSDGQAAAEVGLNGALGLDDRRSCGVWELAPLVMASLLMALDAPLGVVGVTGVVGISRRALCVALGVNPDGLLVSLDQHEALLDFERTSSDAADAVWPLVQVKVWS